jgi:hypothetical protein
VSKLFLEGLSLLVGSDPPFSLRAKISSKFLDLRVLFSYLVLEAGDDLLEVDLDVFFLLDGDLRGIEALLE